MTYEDNNKLSNEYEGIHLWGWSGRDVHLTVHIFLALRLRMYEVLRPLSHTSLRRGA
jgi:hypothetical protein